MKRKRTQRNGNRLLKDFLSPRDVADRSGIGLMGIYKLLESGQLPGIRVGARWYIPTAAYESRLENWNKAPLTAA